MSEPATEKPVVDHRERLLAAFARWTRSRAEYEKARQVLYEAIREGVRPVMQGGGGLTQSGIANLLGWDRRNVWLYVHEWRGRDPGED